LIHQALSRIDRAGFWRAFHRWIRPEVLSHIGSNNDGGSSPSLTPQLSNSLKGQANNGSLRHLLTRYLNVGGELLGSGTIVVALYRDLSQNSFSLLRIKPIPIKYLVAIMAKAPGLV